MAKTGFQTKNTKTLTNMCDPLSYTLPHHMLVNLCELPFGINSQQVVTKGYLNLQNRNDLLSVEDITADEWMDIQFELQPTIYKLKEGDTLRLVLYTTDFEITIRDNTAYHLTVDLEQSSLSIPCQKV